MFPRPHSTVTDHISTFPSIQFEIHSIKEADMYNTVRSVQTMLRKRAHFSKYKFTLWKPVDQIFSVFIPIVLSVT